MRVIQDVELSEEMGASTGRPKRRMVTAENTAKKYRGRMAANYEAKREKQLRWKLENKAVHNILLRHAPNHKTVLDCPVGAGRFLALYEQFNLECVGYDTSEEMLALAKGKQRPGKLELGNIKELPLKNQSVDISICVRFLDLVPDTMMRVAMTELARVTKHHIILTIRLGSSYIAKVNTATHDAKKFEALCNELNFAPIEEVPIFQQGWKVMLLERTA
jgi:ubiquinone/menaquinone biosynthesis C-methylase UbiE